MPAVLAISQVTISLLLIALILLQRRGTALTGIFGGEGGSWHERRGLERVIFWLTILMGFLFIVTSLGSLFAVS